MEADRQEVGNAERPLVDPPEKRFTKAKDSAVGSKLAPCRRWMATTALASLPARMSPPDLSELPYWSSCHNSWSDSLQSRTSVSRLFHSVLQSAFKLLKLMHMRACPHVLHECCRLFYNYRYENELAPKWVSGLLPFVPFGKSRA